MIQVKIPIFGDYAEGQQEGDILKLKLGKDELEKLREWAKTELKTEATETKIIAEIKSLLDEAYDLQAAGIKIVFAESELKEEEFRNSLARDGNRKKHEALAAKAKPILEKIRISYEAIKKLNEVLSSIEQQGYRFSMAVFSRVDHLQKLMENINEEIRR